MYSPGWWIRRGLCVPKFVDLYRIATTHVHQAPSVYLADGSIQRCTHAVINANLRIGVYRQPRTFYVLEPGSFDVSLGKPFLTEYNPDIDWRTNTLTFTFQGQQCYLSPTHANAPTPSVHQDMFISPNALKRAIKRKDEGIPVLGRCLGLVANCCCSEQRRDR